MPGPKPTHVISLRKVNYPGMPTVEALSRSKKSGNYKAVNWAGCPGVTASKLLVAGYNPLAVNHFRKIKQIMRLIKVDRPPKPGAKIGVPQFQLAGKGGKSDVWAFEVKMQDLLLARQLIAQEKVWKKWKKDGVISHSEFVRPPIEY